MAWTFVPEVASALQPLKPSDSAEPSATSSVTSSVNDCCDDGCSTGGCRQLLSGMTSRISTGDRGVDAWISCLEASRANLTASPASEPEETTNAIYGPTSGGSFAKWDPASCCWRTFQACLALTEEPCLDAYSGTWPRAGMTRSGTAYRLQPLAPLTGVIGSGLWPTPVAQDDNKSPEAHMAMKARMKGGPRQTCTSLQVMVKGCARGMWPTPCVADAMGGRTSKGSKRPGECGMAKMVKQWPTPSARDWRSGKASQMTLDRNSGPLNEVVTERDPQGGGSLNPTWTEWLMGWPLGWTDCAPLATAGFRKWRQSLLDALQGD